MRAAAGNGPQRFGETGKQVQGGCSFMRFLHKPTLQSSEPTGLTLAVVMSCGLLQSCFHVADMRERSDNLRGFRSNRSGSGTTCFVFGIFHKPNREWRKDPLI